MNKPYTWKNKARRNMTVVGKIMWWTWAIRIHSHIPSNLVCHDSMYDDR
jgi:hypothetical protein